MLIIVYKSYFYLAFSISVYIIKAVNLIKSVRIIQIEKKTVYNRCKFCVIGDIEVYCSLRRDTFFGRTLECTECTQLLQSFSKQRMYM